MTKSSALKRCPDCHVYFEDNWTPSQGSFHYCPKCGKRPEDFQDPKDDKVQAPVKPIGPKLKKAPAAVLNKILADPITRFAYRFAEKLFAEYGYSGKPIFRNGRISTAGTNINFKYESVRRAYEKGFYEYATYRYLWTEWHDGGYLSHTGLRGVWELVIHEFAHVIQRANGERWYRSVHNKYWAGHVQELQVLFPLAEVQQL